MRSADRQSAGASERSDGAINFGRLLTERSTEVKKRVTSWRSMFDREMKNHPVRSVGIAVGAGYVLGGGLFSALSARLIALGARIALRLALVPLVTQSVVQVAEGFMPDRDETDGETRSETRSARHSSQKDSNQKDKETES
jgi:hypothetical protein